MNDWRVIEVANGFIIYNSANDTSSNRYMTSATHTTFVFRTAEQVGEFLRKNSNRS